MDLVFLHVFHVQVLIGLKMCLIFGADNNSSVHKDNKKKCILVFGEDPKQDLDDTTIMAEAKYPINFLRSVKNFCLILHYNMKKTG